jgi:ribosomal protein S18 acetylase RimI-like enzyme
LCLDGERVVGLVTYEPGDAAWQILTLNAFERRRGIGSGLLNAVVDEATAQGARRVWLVTSNDNLDALRFYQRRGMRLAAVHAGALDEARRLLKPSLPEVGDYGIAVRDEIELEIRLGP